MKDSDLTVRNLLFVPTGLREHMLSFLSRSDVLTFRTTHRAFTNRAAWRDFVMDANFPYYAHLLFLRAS
jgi:hypothetical protein